MTKPNTHCPKCGERVYQQSAFPTTDIHIRTLTTRCPGEHDQRTHGRFGHRRLNPRTVKAGMRVRGAVIEPGGLEGTVVRLTTQQKKNDYPVVRWDNGHEGKVRVDELVDANED